VFIDHNARYEGHSGIALAAEGLVKKLPNFVFTERGEIMVLHGVGKLNWGCGLAGAAAVVTGTDVLVINGDKIGAIYPFLDPPNSWSGLTCSARFVRRISRSVKSGFVSALFPVVEGHDNVGTDLIRGLP
jgi:hypothetical protein